MTTTAFTTKAHTPRQLPSGRWQGAFRLPSGKSKTKTFESEIEAWEWSEAAVAAAYRAAAEGDPLTFAPAVSAPSTPTGPTLAAYAEVWFETRENLATQTVKGYRWHVDAIKGDAIGDRLIDDLTLTDVELWRNRIHRAGVGAPSVNARLKVLRMICRRALADRKTSVDPTAGVKELATDIAETVTISREEEARLLDAATTAQDRAMILLGVDAGLRWQEAAAVPLAAIDGEFVIVANKIERGTREPVRRTKGGKPRRVPMTRRLAAAIAEVVAERGDLAPADLLFVGPDGGPLDYANWRHRSWKGLRHRAGLGRADRRIGFHALRHTYATRLANGTAPQHEIQGLLGHADGETTRVYLHRVNDDASLALVRGILEPEDGQNAA